MKLTHCDIYLFWPNIIGYVRVICLLISCMSFMKNPYIAIISYIVSIGMDAIDGKVARAFNQSTIFGGYLDMITDRCTTMSLVSFLMIFYPRYALFFVLVNVIDMSSHWSHVHSNAVMGNQTHKSVKKEENIILSYYYSNKNFFYSACIFSEGFYVWMYILNFVPIFLVKLMVYFTFPFALLKIFINLVQLKVASDQLISLDVKNRNQNVEK
ncbi:hypothetical protein A3Q56_05839 [Intoshia linei]|uniref:CDP-diacylglycerol--inositol 3-phosphatidyltransferase n=1 Tax=Intoshia linei TaxID=1819745 RepID=A0A177AYE3_9BILA|nr:hypothetical protein A3Q56_05839 [Intoshia linei]